MAASQEVVKAMSPQETSKWCSSLALCGVRGRILRDLQDQIIRRQIDGLLFDKILRSNALQEFGIEELNPRLALAIRRSWTTDFNGISFVDWESNRDVQQQQQMHMQQQREQQQQQHHQHGPPFDARDSDHMMSGRPGTRGGPPQQSWAGPGGEFAGRSAGPPFGTDRWADRRSAAPPMDEPRGQFGGGPGDGPLQSPMGRRGGGYAEPITHSAYDHQPYESQGYPPASKPMGSPGSMAHHSLPPYQTDIDVDGPGRPPLDFRRGGYPARPDPRMEDTMLPPDNMMHDPRRGGYGAGPGPRDPGPRDPGPRDYRGNDMDLPGGQYGLGGLGQGRGFPPPGHADPDRGLRGRLDYGGDLPDTAMDGPLRGGMRMGVAGSPGDRPPMHGGPGMLDPQDLQGSMHGEHRAPARGSPPLDWGGGGLGETFAPRGPAPNTYQQSTGYESIGRRPGGRAPPMDEDQWGGGLDDLMPPRQRITGNVAQARGGLGAKGDGRGAQEDWGVPEADGPRQQRGAPPQEPPFRRMEEPPMEEAEPDHADGPASWTLPARQNGGGGGAPDSRRGPPGRAKAAEAWDESWGGSSLGEALAPKKAKPPPQQELEQPMQPQGGGSSASTGARAQREAPPQQGSQAPSQSEKSPEQIVAWLQTLPESHVPEKSRAQLSSIVECEGLSGSAFSKYVQSVPPEVCAPKHAMKLKAAWANVLKEAAAREVALSNLANQPKQKATMLVV